MAEIPHASNSCPTGQYGKDNHDRLPPAILCKIDRFWLRDMRRGVIVVIAGDSGRIIDVSNSDQLLSNF